MKRTVLALAVVVASGLAVAAATQGAGNSEKVRLQGSWELSKMSIQGKEFTLPSGAKMSVTFQGNKVIARQNGKPDEETTYTLDTSKKPHEMIVAPTSREKEMKGIFKIEGDTLTFAVGNAPDTPPPSGFDARDAMVMIFKRADKRAEGNGN